MALAPEHRALIGSSDIANLARIHDGDLSDAFGSPTEVYQRIMHGYEPDLGDRGRMGDLCEPIMLDVFQREYGVSVVKPPTKVVNDRFRLSPDGLISRYDGCPWEAKWTAHHNRSDWGTPGTDEIPRRVDWQVQWQMLHLGKSKAFVSVMFGGPNVENYRVEADPQMQKLALEIANDFWETHIIPGKAPAIIADDAPVLRDDDLGKPRGDDPLIVKLSQEDWDLCLQLQAVRAGKKNLEEREAELKARLFVLANVGTEQGKVWLRHPEGGEEVQVARHKEKAAVSYKGAFEELATTLALAKSVLDKPVNERQADYQDVRRALLGVEPPMVLARHIKRSPGNRVIGAPREVRHD